MVVACSLVFLFFCLMNVGGSPTPVDHASAASDKWLWNIQNAQTRQRRFSTQIVLARIAIRAYKSSAVP
jgi:hypothetical protein